jgi:hypothetical protein
VSPERERQAQGCAGHQASGISAAITRTIRVQRDQPQQDSRQQLNQRKGALGYDAIDEIAGGRAQPADIPNAAEHDPKQQQRGSVARQKYRNPNGRPDQVAAHDLWRALTQRETRRCCPGPVRVGGNRAGAYSELFGRR